MFPADVRSPGTVIPGRRGPDLPHCETWRAQVGCGNLWVLPNAWQESRAVLGQPGVPGMVQCALGWTWLSPAPFCKMSQTVLMPFHVVVEFTGWDGAFCTVLIQRQHFCILLVNPWVLLYNLTDHSNPTRSFYCFYI